ncbi:MAG: nucleotidyltransferase domain-containing protein [Bacteroidetes bacterium]|nr:nucleotidyltransferase domain-containing protein [Bacteroidota bacterium]
MITIDLTNGYKVPTAEEALILIKNKVLSVFPADRYTVFLFGSRVTGHANQFSDYDIGVIGPERIPITILGDLKEQLDESIIPCFFDVVDFSRVSERFYRTATEQVEIWQQGPVTLKD